MNVVWSSVAIGLFALAAGAAVAGGEPALAELRFAEAATMAAVAGLSTVCLLEAGKVTAAEAATPID